MKISHLYVWAVLVFLSFSLEAQVIQTIPGSGSINWQNQIIMATGIGAPDPKVPFAAQRAGAIRVAKIDALRQMLETVKGMTISSETTVRNAMIENDVVETNISGVVRNFKVVDTRYLSDGSIEVDVEIPLSGILLNEMLPRQVGGKIPGSLNYDLNANAAFTSGVYTGLIIDARGLNLKPAMAPKILDQNGNEVYGTGYVSREYAVQIGVVGYEKDIERAKKDARVTDNAIVVKAVSVSGENQTDIVISNVDAANIQAAAKNLNFMEQCKVMFIVD